MYSYGYQFQNMEPFLRTDNLKKFTPFSVGPFYSIHAGVGYNRHRLDMQFGIFQYRWHDFKNRLNYSGGLSWVGYPYVHNNHKALNIGIQYRYDLYVFRISRTVIRLFPIAGVSLQKSLQPNSSLSSQYTYNSKNISVAYSHSDSPLLLAQLGAETEVKILKGLSFFINYNYYQGFANQRTSRFQFKDTNSTQEGYQKTNGSGQYLSIGLRAYPLDLEQNRVKWDSSHVESNKNSFYINSSYGGFWNQWTTTNDAIKAPDNGKRNKLNRAAGELSVGYRYNKNFFETGYSGVNSHYIYNYNNNVGKRGEQYAWIPVRYKRVVASAFRNHLEMIPSVAVGLFIHEGLSEASFDPVNKNQLTGYNQNLNRFVGGIEGGFETIWNYRKWGIGIYSRYLYGFQPSHYLYVYSPQGQGTVDAYLQGFALGGQLRFHIRKQAGD